MADTKNERQVAGETTGNGVGPARNGHANGRANGSIEGEQDTRQVVLPTGATNGHSGNGNGNGKYDGHDNGSTVDLERVGGVRPVRVRLGITGSLGNGHANGNGYGAGALNGTGKLSVANGNGNGHKARVSFDTQDIVANETIVAPPTSPLRESDLAELRLRLKTQEWPVLPMIPGRGRRRHSGKRPLPPFLMRHRQLRSRSRVGNVRSLVAARRHGKGGAMGIVSRIMALLFVFSFLLTSVAFGGGFAGAGYYIGQLPPVGPDALAKGIVDNGIIAQTTKIYDRNGVPLYDFVDEETGLHEELGLEEISPLVISATIAAEDASFWTNPGIDPYAIARAVIINLNEDADQSGASTITQQLARNIFMSLEERREQSYARKIKEAAIAVQMTRTYSKEYIMELYLNQTYYGHRAYGVGAAARTYFGKTASELNLAEAALIAGLAQLPDAYDPFKDKNAAEIRQEYVLEQMAKLNMITPEQKAEAEGFSIALKPDTPSIKAPHFVYYVKEYLEQKYGASAANAGLKVYTTLDLSVQDAAQRVARDRIDEIRKQKASNAAMVVMKPNTGEILAMVGSVDYNDLSIDGQVNVTTRPRQPGSSFKPITYANAFRKGWSPGTVLLDTLTAFPNPGQKDYAPKNYDGKDHGWVSVREALANSYNIPAVKTIQFAGVQDTIDFARTLGLKSKDSLIYDSGFYGLSLTLGGGEVTLLDMTNAYSTFANGGREIDANPILKIVDAQDRVIYQLDENQEGDQVLDPRIAYMITSILSDNRARTPMFGPNSALKLSVPAAAKTGTTDDNRDSWTLGYTPNLTVGVWVGNNNNAEMAKVTGAVGAATIWHNFMEEFYKNPDYTRLVARPDGKLQRDFVEPAGLIKKWACSEKGDINDYFLEEKPPKGCTTYKDKNKQLRSAPSPNQNQNQQPRTRPTPMPGIVYPTPIP